MRYELLAAAGLKVAPDAALPLQCRSEDRRTTERLGRKGSYKPPAPFLLLAGCPPAAQADQSPPMALGTSREGAPTAVGSSATASLSFEQGVLP